MPTRPGAIGARPVGVLDAARLDAPAAIVLFMLPDWVFDEDDRRHMAEALEEARRAADGGDVPVGAVVVVDGTVVARAGNRRQRDHDPAGHAEILALRQAAARTGDWRLDSATMYVTLEPCPMCTAACRQARLDLVIWGAPDPVAGACGSVLDLAGDSRMGPALAQRGGLGAEDSQVLLRDFFAKSRESS
jgi:tRNA(adenine34) deaminase